MLYSIISLVVFISAAFFAFAFRFNAKRTHRAILLSKYILALGLFLAILFGLILTPLLCSQLNKALATTTWPTVRGRIISSDVIGERAFRPEVTYEYIINSDTLMGLSNLNVPGFGGRMNRLDAAEKLVQLYPPNAHITVSYNPDNVHESTLSPHPTYSAFLELGTSTLLYLIGVTIIFLRLFKRDLTASTPRSAEKNKVDL